MSGEGERRALVTGATGYVGRRLVEHVHQGGWEVHALVRPGSDPLALRAPSHVYDGTRGSLVNALVRSQASVVFHVASAVVVEHSPGDVEAILEANVRMPTLMLDAMREAGVSRMVNTGTSWQHFEGDGRYLPANLYAASKQALEDIALYYASAHGFQVVTLKLLDVYGPRDERRKVIPLLLGVLKTGARLAMSPGGQDLDLVHVNDVVEAYRVAAERILPDGSGCTEAFAVGSGEVRSLREVVALLQTLASRPLDIDWGGRPYRAREVMQAWSEGEPPPGWRARWSLEAGLRDVLSAEGLLPADGEDVRA